MKNMKLSKTSQNIDPPPWGQVCTSGKTVGYSQSNWKILYGFRIAALDRGGGALLPFCVLWQKMCQKTGQTTKGHDLAKIGHPGTPIWTPKWPRTGHLSSKPDPDGAY